MPPTMNYDNLTQQHIDLFFWSAVATRLADAGLLRGVPRADLSRFDEVMQNGAVRGLFPRTSEEIVRTVLRYLSPNLADGDEKDGIVMMLMNSDEAIAWAGHFKEGE